MRIVRTLLLASFLAAAALGADADPWIVQVPRGIDIMQTIATSKRSYAVNPAEKAPADANGPERAELALSAEERDGVANARALIGKGDHDAAAKVLDELLAKNAANWDAHLVRATSLSARGSSAEALVALRTSLIGNRRSPEAWKLLDDVAKSLAKKVVRPKFDLRGWVREKSKTSAEVGSVFVKDADFPWTYYAAARAEYRWEGGFARDFPGAKAYAFTFKEQMYAMCVLADAAEEQRKEGRSNPDDLKRLLAERKAATLTQLAFFAVWPEPLTAAPEPGMDALRPRLEKYFDEKIVVRK